jgi:protoporphyrin/coproporphyrin ferrochelatase
MTTQQKRIAVVLFNLGGPDGQEAVRPFLFNLFNDKWIIAAPAPIRLLIAGLISTTRAKSARANYAKMGGGSPIVPQTQAQAVALERELSGRFPNAAVKVFIAMRYWKPFAEETAKEVKAWGATETILAPLYPQFSSTTTSSAIEAWGKTGAPVTATLCCYPAGAKFAQAHAAAILEAWEKGGRPDNPRVLFSAHGLPQQTINKGDSYQWQVERTVEAVRPLLPAAWQHRICYQSRVGPLKWIGPSTEEEIDQAANDKIGVIVSPIAFVSEHIETLVELDEEYGERAHAHGVPYYLRAPALGAAQGFIDALADLVEHAAAHPGGPRSETGSRICPGQFGLCPMKTV